MNPRPGGLRVSPLQASGVIGTLPSSASGLQSTTQGNSMWTKKTPSSHSMRAAAEQQGQTKGARAVLELSPKAIFDAMSAQVQSHRRDRGEGRSELPYSTLSVRFDPKGPNPVPDRTFLLRIMWLDGTLASGDHEMLLSSEALLLFASEEIEKGLQYVATTDANYRGWTTDANVQNRASETCREVSGGTKRAGSETPRCTEHNERDRDPETVSFRK